MQLEEALAIARQSRWLSQHDRRIQDTLCSRMRLITLPKGRTLFDMEDMASELYCVVSGCAVITIAHPVQGVVNAHVMFPGPLVRRAGRAGPPPAHHAGLGPTAA